METLRCRGNDNGNEIVTRVDLNYSNMASMKPTENRSKCDCETVQFIPMNDNQESMESYESGYCSPPLWKNRRPSPSKSPTQAFLSHHGHRCISPNPRLQAIVRGQFELMELVKNMPESSYELSLKDLVETPKSETRVPPNNNGELWRRSQESKKNDRITRSASFENKGLLLKLVFPVGLQPKRKKSFDKTVGGRAELCGERDWWKKRFTGSTDSESSRTSGGASGHSEDSIRKRNGLLRNCCWPFF